MERATCWSVTINNPIPADDENISQAKQKSGWNVEGQLERGEEGTPHYQLIVKTPQVRFSAIKKQFPRAHIEVARNVKALQAYVHKDETKIGELPVNDKYPSLSKLWDLFNEWLEFHPKYRGDQWLDLYGELWLPVFDRFVCDKIEEGYHIESMAVNPQIRSSIKNYGYSIIIRSKNNKNASIDKRQTDRQSETLSVDMDITDASSQENESEASSQTSSSEGSGW